MLRPTALRQPRAGMTRASLRTSRDGPPLRIGPSLRYVRYAIQVAQRHRLAALLHDARQEHAFVPESSRLTDNLHRVARGEKKITLFHEIGVAEMDVHDAGRGLNAGMRSDRRDVRRCSVGNYGSLHYGLARHVIREVGLRRCDWFLLADGQ